MQSDQSSLSHRPRCPTVRLIILTASALGFFVCAGITCDPLMCHPRSAFRSLAPPSLNLRPPSPSVLPLTILLRRRLSHKHPFSLPKMKLADFIENAFPFSLPHYITHYVPGQTPISTNKAVGTALVSYLAIIFGLQELMKTRGPLKLNALFQLHNAILTLGSGLLLVCMAEEVVPILWRTGLFNAICSEKSWTPVCNRTFSRWTFLDVIYLEMNLPCP